jgi:hypothetical protein
MPYWSPDGKRAFDQIRSASETSLIQIYPRDAVIGEWDSSVWIKPFWRKNSEQMFAFVYKGLVDDSTRSVSLYEVQPQFRVIADPVIQVAAGEVWSETAWVGDGPTVLLLLRWSGFLTQDLGMYGEFDTGLVAVNCETGETTFCDYDGFTNLHHGEFVSRLIGNRLFYSRSQNPVVRCVNLGK